MLAFFSDTAEETLPGEARVISVNNIAPRLSFKISGFKINVRPTRLDDDQIRYAGSGCAQDRA